MLRLYMTVKKTVVLGPYNRYAVWVQGCHNSCSGCLSPDSQSMEGGYEVEVESLAADVLATPDIEGITISGGEPYLQDIALAELLKIVKSKRDLGVIIYTGMLYSEIQDSVLTKYCDVIVDGKYQENLNDGLSLRGSSNQKVTMLTQRYAEKLDMYGSRGRKIEMHFMKDGFTMVGIPDTKSLSMLNEKVFDVKPNT